MGRITRWGMGETAKTAGRVFVFCFFFGILAGTVVGNLGFLEIPQALEGGGRAFWGGKSLLDFGNAVMLNRPWRMEGGSAEKFFYIGKERLGEGLAAWLLGLTVCALFLGAGGLYGVFLKLGGGLLYGSDGLFGAFWIFFVLFSPMAVLSAGLVSVHLAGSKPACQGKVFAVPFGPFAVLFGGGG